MSLRGPSLPGAMSEGVAAGLSRAMHSPNGCGDGALGDRVRDLQQQEERHSSGPSLPRAHRDSGDGFSCRLVLEAMPASGRAGVSTATQAQEVTKGVAEEALRGACELRPPTSICVLPRPPPAQARPRSQKTRQNSGSTPTPCLDKTVPANTHDRPHPGDLSDADGDRLWKGNSRNG